MTQKWILGICILLSGCATGQEVDEDNPYSYNAFYNTQAPPPNRGPYRPQKFYNQVCVESGTNPYGSKSFNCYYDE
ncbi:MAG: hypothetical protein IT289_04925 [Oligoflexia bacterium]|nr:hypothetical protein [Oligoflexia bacterium]